MDNKLSKKKIRQLKGVVVSDKMMETAVIKVERLKLHPKYKKYYRVSKKFKAHNKGNQFHTGDEVIIEETRPLSKEKRWKIKCLA
ncbi:MAG: 30S ribosomal protein S17 [Parcubacteria group bacterium ADurb.Bin305]|mgnify:CR=1 FL=1|jgi:small subunit ribosomal protein S17|nr:30S ribosomal protein S17 [Candidatus Paceibacterota bacterium]MDD3434758.1 30S ribosomal protein S17 [Candidatus Paceibacterota bacterium]OQA44139.1 MAG: 30S ribosomal protein S17 [Parcubacteria group bacterium ADurb.Bin305]